MQHQSERQVTHAVRDEIVDSSAVDATDAAIRPGTTSEGGLSEEEARIREELVRRLRQAQFPDNRDGLLRQIGEADGRGDLAARLRTLPVERSFTAPEDVLGALGGLSSEEPPTTEESRGR